MPKMSSQARERLSKFNAEQQDWTGKCRKCGKDLQGSIKQLMEHQCANPPADNT